MIGLGLFQRIQCIASQANKLNHPHHILFSYLKNNSKKMKVFNVAHIQVVETIWQNSFRLRSTKAKLLKSNIVVMRRRWQWWPSRIHFTNGQCGKEGGRESDLWFLYERDLTPMLHTMDQKI